MVARLEEIEPTTIEMSGKSSVVQYRGQMLPLVSLAEVMGLDSEPVGDKPLQIVVYSEEGRSAGLVVDRIIDTVQAAGPIERRGRVEGVVGSMVIQGRVTDVIDPQALIRKTDPAFFDALASV
jgi:two-component system chemotaxis sensor kinase CheA